MSTVEAEQVLGRIKSVVSEVMRIDEGKIGGSSRFVEDLGADSLDKVTLLMALEDEFGRPISDTDAEGFTTVQAVVDFVGRSSDGKVNG
ncbi:MAG: acyl carrier protein [Chitinispirillaceae bacterium]